MVAYEVLTHFFLSVKTEKDMFCLTPDHVALLVLLSSELVRKRRAAKPNKRMLMVKLPHFQVIY